MSLQLILLPLPQTALPVCSRHACVPGVDGGKAAALVPPALAMPSAGCADLCLSRVGLSLLQENEGEDDGSLKFK